MLKRKEDEPRNGSYAKLALCLLLAWSLIIAALTKCSG